MPATLEGFVRSVTRGVARAPRSEQTCLSFSSARSTRTTFAPAASRTLAHAKPIPEAAPVTAATFPFSSSLMMRLTLRMKAPMRRVERDLHRCGRWNVSLRPIWTRSKPDFVHPLCFCPLRPQCRRISHGSPNLGSAENVSTDPAPATPVHAGNCPRHHEPRRLAQHERTTSAVESCLEQRNAEIRLTPGNSHTGQG